MYALFRAQTPKVDITDAIAHETIGSQIHGATSRRRGPREHSAGEPRRCPRPRNVPVTPYQEDVRAISV